jgi:predicted metal-dependent enzyme (double-stranded beta helix superfamily)
MTPGPVSVPRFERDLDREALRRVVSDLAARREVWRPLVTLDAERRRFEQLWRDEHLDVWVISWMHGHDTGFHDHDVSRGAVAVVAGAILEERLVLGGPPLERRHRAPAVFDFDAAHVHRMRQDSRGAAVSIHAYSPPLWRMGTYAVGVDGTLRRASISYAEELRPVDAAA